MSVHHLAPPRAAAVRSTYIDRLAIHTPAGEPALSWEAFTADRLAWIYQGEDRSAAQAADLKAWRELGR